MHVRFGHGPTLADAAARLDQTRSPLSRLCVSPDASQGFQPRLRQNGPFTRPFDVGVLARGIRPRAYLRHGRVGDCWAGDCCFVRHCSATNTAVAFYVRRPCCHQDDLARRAKGLSIGWLPCVRMPKPHVREPSIGRPRPLAPARTC